MINKNNKQTKLGMFFLLGILLVVSFASASYMETNFNSFGSGIGISSWDFDKQICGAGQDFVIQITPFGCTPAVVRSDLLEEENVPVFCQLSATKINPLIDVEAIDSISFSGQYPKEVSGMGFHPARAALGVQGNLNSPILNNIGYVVIVLKKQPNESAMPEFVEGNLTARIKYNIKNAFGIGKASFYLPEMTDSEFENNANQYSFWEGKGYLRVESIDVNSAVISIYDYDNAGFNRIASIDLKKGETSRKISVPTLDNCLARLQLKLDSFENPDTRAKLNINGDIVEVGKEEWFLENRCKVKDIQKQGINQKVKITCKEDSTSSRFSKTNTFNLMISPRVNLTICNKEGEGCETKEHSVGDRLFQMDDSDKKFVYLGYVDYKKDEQKENLYVVLFASPESRGDKLSEDEINSMAFHMKLAITDDSKGIPVISAVSDLLGKIIGEGIKIGRWFVKGDSIKIISSSQDKKLILTKQIKVEGFAKPKDVDLGEEIKQNYDAALKDYNTLIDSFSNEQYSSDGKISYGERAFFEKITLALDLGQKKTAREFCSEFKQRYPDSKLFNDLRSDCNDMYKFSSSSISSRDVSINGLIKHISFEGIYEPSEKDYSASIRIKGPEGNSKTITLTKDQIVYLDDFRDEKIFSVNKKEAPWPIYFIFKDEWYFTDDLDHKRIKVSKAVEEFDIPDIPLDYGPYQPYRSLIDGLKGKGLEEGKELIEGQEGTSTGTNEFIQLVDLENDYAVLNINLRPAGAWDVAKGLVTSPNKKLEKNVPTGFGSGYVFTLVDINLKKSAKVSVIPWIDNTGTEANFSFKIGIEKRDIQLSPEKTREKIEFLNETIEKWEDRSEKLGKVVKGLKTACLGVGAFLTVKNFFISTEGKAIARQEVMRGKGGIYDMCEDAIGGRGIWGDEGYKTPNECLTDQSDFVDKAVEERAKIIEANDEYYKDLQDDPKITTTNWLGERTINDEELAKKVFTDDNINELIKTLKENDITEIEIDGKKKTVEEIVKMIDEKTYSIHSFRDLQVEAESAGVDSLKKMAGKKIEQELASIYVNNYEDAERKSFGERTGYSEYSNVIASKKLDEIKVTGDLSIKDIVLGTKGKQYYFYEENEKITDKDNVYFIKDKTSGGREYLIVYDNDGSVKQTYQIEESSYLIKYTGDDLGKSKVNDQNPFGLVFKKYDSSTYQNQYKSSSSDPSVNRPILSYYETEPYKGLPAIVPFDCTNGWYVSAQQVTGAFGSLRAYDDSGVARNYYICNVGENKKEENRGGDDICRMINKGTGQPYDVFPGLSKSDAIKLVRKAENAIQTASRNYKTWTYGKTVKIGNCRIKVGKPAVDIPDMQCQDFMSPKDCQLLFNVCDPVVCPSSRCNFGGTYHVKDVIQSGIIGSLLLCSPNYREGIYIPICLSGVKAGIDGLLSVYHSYRDCLQESLDTGKTVGICDEIHSIHLCEFFWRQSLPLAKIIIPKVMEIVMGQNVRGGGEYLGVARAWQNAEKSVDYFAQYYAATSYEAFKARIIEGVGDAVCQNSISASYPEGGSILDSLTDPNSPPQFHGRFDEIPFTTVTNPPISHYKVYYHIYAGDESRAYYEVYLKADDDSTFYQDAPIRYVASGYIATGGYASETKDFTAPSGYKKMCINVNGQEECGFKQVSTSYAINYIQDKHAAEQASQTDIDSEKECISGTASVYSLLNPNLQSAGEELIDPKIYNRGIIRICATSNPGKGTDGYYGTNESRWVQVGYCDRNKGIRCWQDQASVKEVIKDLEIEGEVLKTQSENMLDILMKEGYLDGDKYNDLINKKDKLMTEKKYQEVIDLVNENLDKVFYTFQKARLLLNRARAYGFLAKEGKSVVDKTVTSDVDEGDVGDGDVSRLGECQSFICGGTSAKGQNVMNGDKCWRDVGREVMQIANEFNENDQYDESVKSDTGVKNFECLVLMIARQEGCLSHCVYDSGKTDPLYCRDGKDKNSVIIGDNGNAIGIMQITKSNYGEHYEFEDNVRYGVEDILIKYAWNLAKRSNEEGRYYSCREKSYSGWQLALRYYNGWFPQDCTKGDPNYVENVLNKKDEIARLFPECKIDETTTDEDNGPRGVTESISK